MKQIKYGNNERIKQKMFNIFGKRHRSKLNEQMRGYITERDFTITSQNCIGGVLYHDLGMQFLSPTINMSFDGPDFIKFLINIEHYVGLELEEFVTDVVPYPVGHLGDIELRFNHYSTFEEAKQKWDERKNRINYKRIFVIATDRDGMLAYDCMEQFNQIIYPKIMYTANKYPQYPWAHPCDCWKGNNQVGTMTGYADLKGHRFYEKYANIGKFLGQ